MGQCCTCLNKEEQLTRQTLKDMGFSGEVNVKSSLVNSTATSKIQK